MGMGKSALRSIIAVEILAMTGFLTYHTMNTDSQPAVESTKFTEKPDKSNVKASDFATVAKIAQSHQKATYKASYEVMNDLYTWVDSKSYYANKEKAKVYVSDSDADSLFASDKDVSGQSYIDTANIKSSLVDMDMFVADNADYKLDKIPVTLVVKVRSTRDADNYSSWNGKGIPSTVMYQGTFVTWDNRFETLKLVDMLDRNV
jgi:hypothetical protein